MGCLHNQPFLTGYIIKKYTISGGRLQPRRRRTTKFACFFCAYSARRRGDPVWSPEPMEKFSFRCRPSAPPLSCVEPRPFSFILPSGKIHFMVGFSFIPSKLCFDGSPFYLFGSPFLPFVGALPCSVPLFLANLLVFSVHIPHAVGATPSSSHDQICLLRGKAAKIHFMVGASSFPQNALRWRFVGALFSGISDVYLFTFSLTFSFLPLVDLLAFFVHIPHAVGATPCGRPNQWENFHFAAVHRRLLSPASNHALFRSFCPWSICPLFLCVFRMP